MEPAKLTKLVRGELDWIVMKTLEKDRNRRYETADAIAEDILHYLKNEPVKACPPSAIYRFRKFARRYKVAFISTGIVALALLFSTIARRLLKNRGRVVMVFHLDPGDLQNYREFTGSNMSTCTTLPQLIGFSTGS